MNLFQLSLLVHFIGMGLIVTTLVGGWILHSQYARAGDLNTKLTLLRVLRAFGLLSPVGIAVMLLSGIANTTIMSYGWLTTGWLSTKIVLFLLVAALGIVFGAKSRTRANLLGRRAEGDSSPDIERRVSAIDSQMQMFYLLQSLFLLAILILTLVKPGQHGS